MILLSLFVLVLLLASVCSAKGESSTSVEDVPVVYVYYDDWGKGTVSSYLLMNIELATLTNNVVLLTDARSPPQSGPMHGHTLQVFNIKDYANLAAEFAEIYVFQGFRAHNSNARKIKNELENFQRWLILCTWMIKTNTPKTFFADGDVSVYAGVTKPFKRKSECDGAINVDRQDIFSWVGAGESSFWTTRSITNFSKFLFLMYSPNNKNYLEETLNMKRQNKPAVVDMSLLWLWWFIHHRHLIPRNLAEASKDAWFSVGMPWHAMTRENTDTWSHNRFKEAWGHVASFPLPTPGQIDSFQPGGLLSFQKFSYGREPLILCNNMNIVVAEEGYRYTFDHCHGWHSGSRVDKWDSEAIEKPSNDSSKNKPLAVSFLDNIGNKQHPCPMCPSILIDAQRGGGVPESLKLADAAKLSKEPVHFLTFHYQGHSKRNIDYDVCRILLLEIGLAEIKIPTVKKVCRELSQAYDDNPRKWPCWEHKSILPDTNHPFCF